MKLQQLSESLVKRTIHHDWEQWDEKQGDNITQTFDLEVWFSREKLNYGTAERLRKADGNEDEFKTILLESLKRWNLDDPISADTFNVIPADLLTKIIESFGALIAGNPTKPSN